MPGRPDSSSSPHSILVVLHQEHSTTGRIGCLLVKQGYTLDIRRPCFGDPLPDTLADHAGAVIFGGPMSVNDPDDYIRREIEWVGVALREEKPFLGICLGAQMLAKHLGKRVGPHPDGRAEVGYYPVHPTAEARHVCATPLPGTVYQWHQEGFDLPCGATLLARGDDFDVQACRYGRHAFGLQFHPEVTYAMICRWTARATGLLNAPGAQPGHQHRADWHRYDAPIAAWMEDFLTRWTMPEGSPLSSEASPARPHRYVSGTSPTGPLLAEA